ncbi:MAG: GatB/YqeY domain-containing protein [Synergistaceae bacterium]|jgi:uncharacterized protein YqeY|nr:GatB/YqeY domain-containing protein [Synergistaceae bacterium]
MACPLEERIQGDLVAALKNRDDATLSVLRMLKASIQMAATEKGRSSGLADEDVVALVRRAVKQRKEAADLYRKGGAHERAAEELEEAGILKSYLPTQMADAELELVISGVIGETGAAGPKDLGRVMSGVMKLAAGRADGKRVKEMAARLLS